jgi:hypothetical protein
MYDTDTSVVRITTHNTKAALVVSGQLLRGVTDRNIRSADWETVLGGGIRRAISNILGCTQLVSHFHKVVASASATVQSATPTRNVVCGVVSTV